MRKHVFITFQKKRRVLEWGRGRKGKGGASRTFNRKKFYSPFWLHYIGTNQHCPPSKYFFKSTIRGNAAATRKEEKRNFLSTDFSLFFLFFLLLFSSKKMYHVPFQVEPFLPAERKVVIALSSSSIVVVFLLKEVKYTHFSLRQYGVAWGGRRKS